MLRQGLQEEEKADGPVVQGIYKLPRAVIINPHELGGLNNRNTLPHSSAGWRSKIEGLTGSVPSEGYEGQSVSGLSKIPMVC